MKNIYFAVSILLLLFSCNKDNDGNEIIPIADYSVELQTLIDTHWAEFADGKQNYPGGYALQILSPVGDYYVAAGDLSETTNKTHFRAGSTTKTFTAAAIMLLHQQQKLNIENIITQLIPGTSEPYLPTSEEFDIPFKDEITIMQLLQHRAGMWDIINQDIPDTCVQPYAGYRYCDFMEETVGLTHTFTIKEMVGVVAANKLYNTKPGTDFHYSDTGMGLLALIVERVSGKLFHEFISENFLVPLNMENTSFPHEGDNIVIPEPGAESSAYYMGETYDVSDQNISMHVGEGNIITTPYDLSLWMKQLYTGNAGVDYNFVRYYMMDCLPTFESHQNYGLGTVYTPELGYGHNGGVLAFFTVARYNPETDVTLVMYTNIWDFNVFEVDFMIELMDMYAVLYETKDIIETN